MFAATVHGAQSSAMAYSIIETAKAGGLNPYQYLLHLLTELPGVITKGQTDRLPQYLPWAKELPERCRKDSLPILAGIGKTHEG